MISEAITIEQICEHIKMELDLYPKVHLLFLCAGSGVHEMKVVDTLINKDWYPVSVTCYDMIYDDQEKHVHHGEIDVHNIYTPKQLQTFADDYGLDNIFILGFNTLFTYAVPRDFVSMEKFMKEYNEHKLALGELGSYLSIRSAGPKDKFIIQGHLPVGH